MCGVNGKTAVQGTALMAMWSNYVVNITGSKDKKRLSVIHFFMLIWRTQFFCQVSGNIAVQGKALMAK